MISPTSTPNTSYQITEICQLNFMSKPYLKAIHFHSPDFVILLGKNDSDRKFLCNFFAKNFLCKSFDVKTFDNLILFVSSNSITLNSFTEMLLNKLLTCCNLPSIIVMLVWLSTGTGYQSQPRGYILMESKNKFWSTFSFKMGVHKRVKSRSSPYKNADII